MFSQDFGPAVGSENKISVVEIGRLPVPYILRYSVYYNILRHGLPCLGSIFTRAAEPLLCVLAIQLGHQAIMQVLAADSWRFFVHSISRVQAARGVFTFMAEGSFAYHAPEGGEAKGQASEKRSRGRAA